MLANLCVELRAGRNAQYANNFGITIIIPHFNPPFLKCTCNMAARFISSFPCRNFQAPF